MTTSVYRSCERFRLANAGARSQRLLWASTSTKDPGATDILYVAALAAPFTINAMPEKTLLAFADNGSVGALMPADGGDAHQVMFQLSQVGLDPTRLASDLQREGAEAFDQSWHDMPSSTDQVSRLSARSHELAR